MMVKGPAKVKMNGQSGPAKAVPPPPPAEPAVPVDPLAFVDELPTKMREAIAAAGKTAEMDGNKKYAEGMRRASRLIAIAVGQLDGASKARISDVLDQLENEAAKAEKTLRA